MISACQQGVVLRVWVLLADGTPHGRRGEGSLAPQVELMTPPRELVQASCCNGRRYIRDMMRTHGWGKQPRMCLACGDAAPRHCRQREASLSSVSRSLLGHTRPCGRPRDCLACNRYGLLHAGCFVDSRPASASTSVSEPRSASSLPLAFVGVSTPGPESAEGAASRGQFCLVPPRTLTSWCLLDNPRKKCNDEYEQTHDGNIGLMLSILLFILPCSPLILSRGRTRQKLFLCESA